MLDPTTDPHPGKIDLIQKHQAHPENSEIPTLTQLSEPQKFSELTQIPGWATYYVDMAWLEATSDADGFRAQPGVGNSVDNIPRLSMVLYDR